MSNHMNIKRIVHRLSEEVKATIEIAKVLNIANACSTFYGKFNLQYKRFNGRIETKRIRRSLIKKHKVMNKYFSIVFHDYLKSYNYNMNLSSIDENYKDCIWVCWWQGLDSAPELVKKCIDSIKRNAGNHKVIIITENNVGDFVEFPEWVIEKKNKGIITRTNLSDLLRLSLLAKYGGMWLDATFFCTESLDQYFDMPVWSIKRPEYNHSSVACGYFAGYSYCCNDNNRWIFASMRDCFAEYWRNYDYMVDYLLVDYMTALVLNNNKLAKKEFLSIMPNNPMCDELEKILNTPYDEKMWKKLKENTRLFKLTWKTSFSTDVEGKETFYGKLMSDEL